MLRNQRTWSHPNLDFDLKMNTMRNILLRDNDGNCFEGY